MELNDEQQESISYPAAPLQVLAGPGSGKTGVIVERAMRLVEDGASQESIMCMTFTEKAAGEMRKRLHDKGYDNIWIGTMHSLCLEMLKDNSVATGITEKTVMFGERARLAWCVRNIDRLDIDPDVVALGGKPSDTCGKILGAIRKAKREMVSADDLEAYIDTDEPTGKKETKKMAQLAEMIKVYRAYDSHKKENDLIDYEDMVSMAVVHLSNDGTMLETYGKKYRHILVDEFQDNNYAQFRLATLLAGSDSITVVGDDDQSVMGFQGAFSGIFEEFGDAYPTSKTVVLNQNYRCSGNILHLSTQLLLADQSRKAKTMHTVKEDGEPIKVVVASNEAAELEFVANEISELSLPYGEIAVLCSTNASCQKFADALRSRGIPVWVASTGRIMRNAAVAEVMALLNIADSPDTAGIYVSSVLKARGIQEHTISAINSKAAQNRSSDDTPVDNVFSALVEYSGPDQDVEILEITRRLQVMIHDAKSDDLLVTLHKIMTEYSDVYKSNANTDGSESSRNLALLNRLYRIAEEYQQHYYGRRLSDFIEYLDMVGDLDSDDRNKNVAEAGDEVSVLTMHNSKGKQFDAVFVTGLYDDDVSDSHKSETFEIPQELLKGKGRIQDPGEAHAREKRNVLYVAMTRARHKLYLTYPRQAKDSQKERKPSRFLDEIAYADNQLVDVIEYAAAAVARATPPTLDVLDAEKTRIQEDACKSVRESRPKAVVRGMVDLARIMHEQNGGGGDFDPRSVLDVDVDGITPRPMPKIRLVDKDSLTLSATKIKDYQKCPLMFKYRRVLRVPEGPSIYLRKGNAVHDTLDWMAKEKMAGLEPDIDAALAMAREKLAPVRDIHPEREYKAAESSLGKIIDRYVGWEAKSPNALVETEVSWSMWIDGIEYKNKVDRVEKNPDGRYEIIDFKTGITRLAKNAVALDPQMNIYAAAVKEKYGSLPAKVSLVYLEEARSIREYVVTEESLQAGLDVVKDCAKNILDEKFDATPSYYCNTCPYNKICPEFISE